MKQKSARTQVMEPSNEANSEQLRLAVNQGDAYQDAVEEMTQHEAHGEEKAAGDYLIGYAVEKAEGMYRYQTSLLNKQLEWVEPKDENAHIEITVRDGADGRFIPGLDVRVTIIDQNGKELETHKHQFLWHPWLFHYGRNWIIPENGEYTLKVHIDPPDFPRHDHLNGKRYVDPVDVYFTGVNIETGHKRS